VQILLSAVSLSAFSAAGQLEPLPHPAGSPGTSPSTVAYGITGTHMVPDWDPATPRDAIVVPGVAPGSEPAEAIGSGDGKIHVIPSLSAPSVKNGGKVTIQAVVKGQRAISRVEARIERDGASADGAGATPPATLMLQPAPMNLGGVNAAGTLGLWQTEWTASGLVEATYRVVLTVTDSSGHAFTDRSLTFSDPTAGWSSIGSTAYPNGGMRRLDAAGNLRPRESFLSSAVIDTAAGYAYFGTYAWGSVVKVSLGSGSSAPTRVGAVTLNAGEDVLHSAVIDPAAGYAYFGTYTSPGIVVKVSLGSGSSVPTRVGAVTLDAREAFLVSAVIDTAAGYAYFGTFNAAIYTTWAPLDRVV
jgi:hypothetical protein